MAWSTPKTWSSEPLTSVDLNTYVRDNQNYLNLRPSDSYTLDESSDYSTTSTAFVDVDATKLAFTITSNGGDVLVHFDGTFRFTAGSGAAACYLDLDIDGSSIAGDDGILRLNIANVNDFAQASFTRFISGLSVGNHTFKLCWKISSGDTVALLAGAGTSGGDLHPQFWVKEI